MPLLDLFWAMLWFFLFVLWLWLVISVFLDIFRTDMSGWAKAAWVVFVIILPFLGVLAYLIAHGGNMHRRAVQRSEDRSPVYTASRVSDDPAEELERLSKLHDEGILTDEAYASEKAKVLDS